MYYQKTYTPRPSDYNRYGKLSYEAILQILESAGSDHSAMAGDSLADANKNGIAWILTEWRVKIIRRPENGESLRITTWVRGKAPASAVYRDFLLTDENGTELILAEAKFALFDLATSKLTRISEELFGSYQPEEKTLFEDAQRLRAPSEFTSEKELQLRRSDIDFNGHMHNTRYVDLAMEALPKDFFENDSVSEIRISYMKPITEDDNVTLKHVHSDNGENILINANGTHCCLVVYQ
ncbi:MAG: acyl-[acyl-carrier-protein] thioesterase [Eubacteriales bacterium]